MPIPLAYPKLVIEGRKLLASWQAGRLVQPIPPFRRADSRVSAVIYHFGVPERIDSRFPAIKCSILETWRHCGIMRTTIVTNFPTPILERFAEEFSPNVFIMRNDALVPGDLPSMSIDCNANLHRYFDSDFVLVIQNDGFPLREGLERFLGDYDYIGAPFVRHTFLTNITGFSRRHAVGNGGFSLRSKRICEQASYHWHKRYAHILPPENRFTREDAFYCCLLPILERAYRRTMCFAPVEEALAFSFDALYDQMPTEKPFGFHGPAAFLAFREKGWV